MVARTDAARSVPRIIYPRCCIRASSPPFAPLLVWVQTIGNIVPLTHFFGATSGVMRRGDGWADATAYALPDGDFLCRRHGGRSILSVARDRIM